MSNPYESPRSESEAKDDRRAKRAMFVLVPLGLFAAAIAGSVTCGVSGGAVAGVLLAMPIRDYGFIALPAISFGTIVGVLTVGLLYTAVYGKDASLDRLASSGDRWRWAGIFALIWIVAGPLGVALSMYLPEFLFGTWLSERFTYGFAGTLVFFLSLIAWHYSMPKQRTPE